VKLRRAAKCFRARRTKEIKFGFSAAALEYGFSVKKQMSVLTAVPMFDHRIDGFEQGLKKGMIRLIGEKKAR
jgi:hypothetical protein